MKWSLWITFPWFKASLEQSVQMFMGSVSAVGV